jgi:hypothetical protein
MKKAIIILSLIVISALFVFPGRTLAAPLVYARAQSTGTIQYSSVDATLGLWSASSPVNIPPEATYVVVGTPDYVKPRPDILPILNWYDLRPPYPNGVNNPIISEADIKSVETELKSIKTSNLWGIIGPICEEYWRPHIQFVDTLNTTWFGESLMGYSVYLSSHPGTTRNQWQDEMWLRFMRGFTDYFHAKGLTVGTTIQDVALSDVSYFYGTPAFNFAQQNLDFVFLYAYTENLADFQQRTTAYLHSIDQLQMPLKFWILTRSYDFSLQSWQVEAKGLELKNSLDKNFVIFTSIYEENPTFSQTWQLILRSLQLYAQNAPYFESNVMGTNLLTSQTGQTYGWVQSNT